MLDLRAIAFKKSMEEGDYGGPSVKLMTYVNQEHGEISKCYLLSGMSVIQILLILCILIYWFYVYNLVNVNVTFLQTAPHMQTMLVDGDSYL